MDEQVTKFLADLSRCISSIHNSYLEGHGGELQSIVMNDGIFNRVNRTLKEANYCDMEKIPVPNGAAGVLWGIPVYTDAKQPDGELQFNLS